MRIFSLRSLSGFALALALATTGGCTLTGSGHLRVPLIVVEEAPPPPPRQEVAVARPDYIWINGYQRWDGGHYVWQEGRYVRERPGYAYAPGRWQRQGHGHVWIEGTWRASSRGRGNGHGRRH